MSGAWDPVGYEDLDEEEPPARGNGGSKTKPSGETAPTQQVLMGMPLAIPPEIATLAKTLADSQKKIAEQLEKYAGTQEILIERLDSLSETIANLTDEMKAGVAEAIGEGLTAMAKVMDERAVAMADSQAAGLAEHGAGMHTLIASLEQAIMAPREVKIQRGTDGIATGAVSRLAREKMN